MQGDRYVSVKSERIEPLKEIASMPYRLVVSSGRPIRGVPIAIDNLQPTWDVSSFGMNLSREKSQHMRMCRYLSSQRYAKLRSLSGSIVDNRLGDSRFMPGDLRELSVLRRAPTMLSCPRKWQK